MTKEQLLRDRLTQLKRDGITYDFISKRLKISNSALCKFVKGNLGLKDENITKLEAIVIDCETFVRKEM